MTDITDIDALAAQVERYELMSTLSATDFEEYYRCQRAYGAQLFDLVTGFTRNFQFDEARDVLDNIVALNQQLQSIAVREIADTADTTRLVQVRDEASGVIMVVQGQICQLHADEHLMSGNIPAGISYLQQALAEFAELSDSVLPQSDFGTLAAALATTKIEFFEATMAAQRGRFELAKDGYRSVDAKSDIVLEDLNAAAGEQDDQVNMMVAEFQREFADQMTYTRIMLNYSELFVQVQHGNFEEAVQYATDAVSMYEAWLQSSINNELPAQVRNIRRVELEYVRGWLAWVEAEHAVETHQWDECTRLVRKARQSWLRSTDMSLRHALRGLVSPQYENANNEMLLESTLRRCRRERELHHQISGLREEMRQLRAVIVHQHGQGNVMGNEETNFNISGPITDSAFGKNVRVQKGNTQNIVSADMRELSSQLGQLREMLSAAASSAEEQEAVEHVAAAEQEARQGNESGMRKHLAAAGRWALNVAERLALPVAEAALKSSLGV